MPSDFNSCFYPLANGKIGLLYVILLKISFQEPIMLSEELQYKVVAGELIKG